MLLLSLELLTSLGPAVVRTGLPRARCAPVHMSIALPEEGLEVEVVCERVAYGGMGIARTETGATVMLSRAVPGDKVRALVTRRRRRHVEAETTEILVPGPATVTPPWSALFASCGGCSLQYMAYAEQLVTKRQWVIDAIARSPGGAAAVLGGGGRADGLAVVRPNDASQAALASAALEPLVAKTVASPRQTRYRNKATFFFGPSDDGDGLVLGPKAAHDAGLVVPLGTDGCPLQTEEADEVLASLAAWAKDTSLRAFDVWATHGADDASSEGSLWQVVLRTAPSLVAGDSDVHLDLVTAGSPSPSALAALESLASQLLRHHPPLARVLHTEVPPPPPPDIGAARGRRRQRRAPAAAVAQPLSTLIAARDGGDGPPLTALVARDGGGTPLRFEVAPRAFWQVNHEGTDELVRLVSGYSSRGLKLARGRIAGEARTARLIDLFCGAGLFAVALAGTARFEHVLGLELGVDAVASAEENAKANGLSALCRFEATDLAFSGKPPAALASALAPAPQDLVVVVDPPRAGLSGAMRAALRRSSATVLVYVSCDVQTLGRDLAELCAAEGSNGAGGGGAGEAFRLAEATPVDLTPHAARVETVCLLWRAACGES